MQRLEGAELEAVLPYFQAAADEAQLATCLRAQCGSVIVAEDGEIIGRGHNSPPLDDETQRTCLVDWDLSRKPKYSKTCCVHAEQCACIDALKRNAQKIGNSTLYFMKIDEHGQFTGGGTPFCTECSRVTMQTGVGKFALWEASSGTAKVWTLPEYNKASYAYYNLPGEQPLNDAIRGGVLL